MLRRSSSPDPSRAAAPQPEQVPTQDAGASSSRKRAAAAEADGGGLPKHARIASNFPAVQPGATSAAVRPPGRPAPLGSLAPVVKPEPGHCPEAPDAKHRAWLAQVTPQQMETVARVLRGKSKANHNCASLAHDMLNFSRPVSCRRSQRAKHGMI